MTRMILFTALLGLLAGCGAAPQQPGATAADAATQAPTPSAAAPATTTPGTTQPTMPALPPTQSPATPTQAAALPPSAAMPQVRAIWADAFREGFHTPEQVRQLVADARRGNLNTLIVQVRRRGDAFYQSSIEPRVESADETHPLPEGFDPLQTLLDEAHAQGIEVHAWIASLPVWHPNPKYQTSNPQHVWRRHGPDAPGHENWIMMRRGQDGTLVPTYSLDPGHPAAAQYTLDVALDIVRKYDVDGLHLDYIRYGGADEGYNPLAVERFNRQHARSGTPEPDDAQWLQWRRDQVTALVRRIYVESTAIKPRLKVSAATITWGAGPEAEEEWTRTAAYARVLQDWRAWTEEGILDQAYAMNYFRAFVPREQQAYEQWIAWEKTHQYGRQVIPGPGIFFNYLEDSFAQIRRALEPTAEGAAVPGIGLYSYASTNIYANDDYRDGRDAAGDLPRQPWEWRPETNATFFTGLSQTTTYTYTTEAGQQTATLEPIFAQHAAVPALPWKESPSTGMLRGTIVPGTGMAPQSADGLSVQLDGPVQRSLRSDGNGWFGAVELPPGRYRATLQQPGGQTISSEFEIQPGAVAELSLRLGDG